jgi:hypothetical protein
MDESDRRLFERAREVRRDSDRVIRESSRERDAAVALSERAWALTISAQEACATVADEIEKIRTNPP